ncbi:DMT family transporter [Vibrio sp. AK197]
MKAPITNQLTNNRKTALALVPWIFVFLWSTGFIGAKYTVAYSEPFYLLFLRGMLSCVAFATLAFLAKAKWPTITTAIKQLTTGLLIQAMFLGGCFKAIDLGMPAAFVSLITGMQPILTAVILTSLYRKRFSTMQWISMAVGFVGVFLVLSPDREHGSSIQITAILASVVGLLGMTMGSIYQKRFKGDGHILTQVFFQYVSLTLIMGILTLVFEKQQANWSMSFILGLGWLVFVVSVSAILLLMFMIENGESTKVATYFYLVPVFTAIESWLLFDESIPVMALTGMGLSLSGLLLFLRSAD